MSAYFNPNRRPARFTPGRTVSTLRADPGDTSGSLLPADGDSERHLLACCMADPAAVAACQAAGITWRAFSLDTHRRVFAAIETATAGGDPPNLDLIVDILRHRDELDAIGGVAEVSALLTDVPSLTDYPVYVELVRTYAARRAIIAAAHEMALIAYHPNRLPEAEQPAEPTPGALLDAVTSHASRVLEGRPTPADVTGITGG